MTKLVLVRHGESEWNKLNLFTGWTDVDLSEKGHEEAKEGGRLLKAEGYDFDTVAARVRSAVTDYINSLGIGKDMLLSNVGEVIYHIEGVADYKFLETYGSDHEVPLNRYAKANTITVRDE